MDAVSVAFVSDHARFERVFNGCYEPWMLLLAYSVLLTTFAIWYSCGILILSEHIGLPTEEYSFAAVIDRP
jgi:Na+/melibiose symporter-like transporter